MDIVKINSFHLKSAHDNVIKIVGIPLMEFMKLQALSYAIKCGTVDLKHLFNIKAVKLFDVIFLISKVICLLN